MYLVKVMLNKKYCAKLKKTIDKCQKMWYSIVKEKRNPKPEREKEALGTLKKQEAVKNIKSAKNTINFNKSALVHRESEI